MPFDEFLKALQFSIPHVCRLESEDSPVKSVEEICSSMRPENYQRGENGTCI